MVRAETASAAWQRASVKCSRCQTEKKAATSRANNHGAKNPQVNTSRNDGNTLVRSSVSFTAARTMCFSVPTLICANSTASSSWRSSVSTSPVVTHTTTAFFPTGNAPQFSTGVASTTVVTSIPERPKAITAPSTTAAAWPVAARAFSLRTVRAVITCGGMVNTRHTAAAATTPTAMIQPQPSIHMSNGAASPPAPHATIAPIANADRLSARRGSTSYSWARFVVTRYTVRP